MRIVCPICSAAYEVRETLLVPGRQVRCARCSEEWVPLAALPPPPPDDAQFEPSNAAKDADAAALKL